MSGNLVRSISLAAGLLACISPVLVPSEFWGDYAPLMIPLSIVAVWLYGVVWSKIFYPEPDSHHYTPEPKLLPAEQVQKRLREELDNYTLYKNRPDRESPEVLFELGLCYRFGRGTTVDTHHALACFLQAAEAGHRDAQEQVEAMYYLGEGTPVEQKKSIEWLTRAAENGSAESRYDLATRYLTGDGVEVDIPKGIYWLERAAKLGEMISQYELAHRLFYGKDVPQDRKKAIMYMKLSARQGWEDAGEFLKRHG